MGNFDYHGWYGPIFVREWFPLINDPLWITYLTNKLIKHTKLIFIIQSSILKTSKIHRFICKFLKLSWFFYKRKTNNHGCLVSFYSFCEPWFYWHESIECSCYTSSSSFPIKFLAFWPHGVWHNALKLSNKYTLMKFL